MYPVAEDNVQPQIISNEENKMAVINNDESKHAAAYVHGNLVEQLNETININNPLINQGNAEYVPAVGTISAEYHNGVLGRTYNTLGERFNGVVSTLTPLVKKLGFETAGKIFL